MWFSRSMLNTKVDPLQFLSYEHTRQTSKPYNFKPANYIILKYTVLRAALYL